MEDDEILEEYPSVHSSSIQLNEPEIKVASIRTQKKYYRQSINSPDCVLFSKSANNIIPEDNELMKIQRELSDIIREGFKSEWAPEWKQTLLMERLNSVVISTQKKSLSDIELNKMANTVDFSTNNTPTLPLQKKKLIHDLLKGTISPKTFFRMVCHSWSSRF